MGKISPLFAVEAEKALDEGRIEEAIDICQKGLEVYPEYPAALVVLGRAYEKLGDSEKSVSTYEQAAEKFPLNKQVDNLGKGALNELPPQETPVEIEDDLASLAADVIEQSEPAEEDIIEEPEETPADIEDDLASLAADVMEQSEPAEEEIIEEPEETPVEIEDDLASLAADVIEQSEPAEEEIIEEPEETPVDIEDDLASLAADVMEQSEPAEEEIIEEPEETPVDIEDDLASLAADVMEQSEPAEEEIIEEPEETPVEPDDDLASLAMDVMEQSEPAEEEIIEEPEETPVEMDDLASLAMDVMEQSESAEEEIIEEPEETPADIEDDLASLAADVMEQSEPAEEEIIEEPEETPVEPDDDLASLAMDVMEQSEPAEEDIIEESIIEVDPDIDENISAIVEGTHPFDIQEFEEHLDIPDENTLSENADLAAEADENGIEIENEFLAADAAENVDNEELISEDEDMTLEMLDALAPREIGLDSEVYEGHNASVDDSSKYKRFLHNFDYQQESNQSMPDINANDPELIPGFEFVMFDSVLKKKSDSYDPEIPDIPEKDQNKIDRSSKYLDIQSEAVRNILFSEDAVEDLESREADIFDTLAAKLENAKIPKIDENIKDNPKPIQNNNKKIISETMANIYAQQGARDEAIDAYQKLAESNPDRAEYFLDKVKELEAKRQ